MTDAQHLEAALDRVQDALLGAQFDKLPKIVAETEGLLAALGPLTDPFVAARLRHKANRNSLCLQAAARGLRSAQRRMGEMAGTAPAFSTYTHRGQRTVLDLGPGALR